VNDPPAGIAEAVGTILMIQPVDDRSKNPAFRPASVLTPVVVASSFDDGNKLPEFLRRIEPVNLPGATRSPVICRRKRLPLATRLSRSIRHSLHWFSPMRAFREIRAQSDARQDFSAGLAIGVFIACLPIYGFQSIVGLFVAKKLKLHPLSVLTGCQLSTPPMGPALFLCAVDIGHVLLHGHWPAVSAWHRAYTATASMSLLLSALKSFLPECAVGSVLEGAVLAVLTFAAVSVLLWFARHRPPAAVDVELSEME
jgi:uncharacterized protein (DUF2062 family)